jgi:hypothetical protein
VDTLSGKARSQSVTFQHIARRGTATLTESTDGPGLDGEASPLVIGEPQAPPAELLAAGSTTSRCPAPGGSCE